jgi:predicted restriction endonuclease
VFTDELESGSKASDVERPKRVKTTVDRIVRDTGIVRDLKEFYNYQCQICSEVRQRTSSAPYAEGHHIHPLGHDPPGPDKRENILVLCPNHHADFDYGMIQLDPDDLEIFHAYEEDVDGEALRVHNNHKIEREHIEYHNQNISSITQS